MLCTALTLTIAATGSQPQTFISCRFRMECLARIFPFGVLEHFEFGPELGLREANRVLRQDGVLVLLMPYPNLIWRLIRFESGCLEKSCRSRASTKPPTRFNSWNSLYVTRDLRYSRSILLDIALLCGGWEVLSKRKAITYMTSSLSEFFGAVCRRLLPLGHVF